MRPAEGGFFVATKKLGPGSKYMYVLDGKKKRPDPVSRYQPEGVFGPSQVVDPEDYEWADGAWKGVEPDDLLIYELHTGTYTEAGTFEAILPHLRRLRTELGVTAIELMPVAQFPGHRNWGYDGVFLYAVQNSYGGPGGLKALVDECHAEGLAVLLDVVYNHVGPEGNCLADYGPYFSYKYKTPWGPAINYDDRGCDNVRRFVIDNALYWVTEYHLDGVRLDAIHGIFDFSAEHILCEMRDSIRGQESILGRRIHLIAESDLNDPRVISPREKGGFDLDAQWSDDFHHSVHAYLTGERFGYYQDFGDLADIEKAIRDGFVYDGRFSKFRDRRFGAPSAWLPGSRFVICIQNHDQVGNRLDGARLSTLLPQPALHAAVGLLLLAPNIPLLFMGEEFGEVRPFHYFTSHKDADLARAVRDGRRNEFKSWGGPGSPFLDPQSPRTFELSRLDHSLRDRAPNARTFRYYSRLISLRREHPALHSSDRRAMEVRRIGRVLGIRRWAREEEIAAIFALGEAPPPVQNFFFGSWKKLFDSVEYEDRKKGGQPSLYGVTVYSKVTNGAAPSG
jgi:maltooligosyltrehalose trehalohydrolase